MNKIECMSDIPEESISQEVSNILMYNPTKIIIKKQSDGHWSICYEV